MSDISCESTYTNSSHVSSVKNFSIDSKQSVALFDWDDTLFCTKYIENMQINLTDIFSFKISFEDNYSYLVAEFKDLENVSR